MSDPPKVKRKTRVRTQPLNAHIGKYGAIRARFIVEQVGDDKPELFFHVSSSNAILEDGKRYVRIDFEYMAIEDLGAMTNYLNKEFARRVAVLTEMSGFEV